MRVFNVILVIVIVIIIISSRSATLAEAAVQLDDADVRSP